MESFLVVFADAHDFADRLHLRAELVLNAFKFFKCPACEFDNDVIARRRVFVERSVAPIRDFGKRHAACKFCRNECDREARCLRRERGRTRGARIDFDDDDATVFRVACELDVRAADNADRVDNFPRLPLKLRLNVRGNGHHRCRAEAVARVHADGIDVFDETNGNERSGRVANDFDFEFFPAENGFFDEALARHRSLQAARDDGFELVHIVDESAAGAAHRVSRADDEREAEFFGNFHRFVNRVGNIAARHVDADARHRFFENKTVFAALDGFEVYADNLDAVFLQNAFFIELDREIQARLPAEIRQKRVRAFLGDDLFEAFFVERLDVSNVGNGRVRHNRRRVRVDEHDFIAALAECFARLRSRVVKLAGLPDYDRTGADNHHFFDIVAYRHSNAF